MKVFGKSIHCLAKIGDEVFLEPETDSLTLRTVNISKSAFATFTFGSTFFTCIERGEKDEEEDQDQDLCKVMVRSLLLPFRSLSCLEKTVENCSIEINNTDCKLLIGLKCRHTVSKKFSLGMLECDPLRAVYDINQCNNKWVIDSKVMHDANNNFLANQEEVTMIVAKDSFKMKNYNDDVDEKKQIHTVLSMQPGEFEQFEINEETSATFCLKEFRSLLLFAEFLNIPINAHFSQGGQPILLSISQGDFLSSMYVLSTLAEDGTSHPTARTPRSCRSAARPPASRGVLHSTQRDGDASTAGVSQVISTPDLSNIPAPPGIQSNFEQSLNIINEDNEEGPDSNEDCFQASPPAKKKKNFLFRRCFDATWNPNKIAGMDNVLAPDSDEET